MGRLVRAKAGSRHARNGGARRSRRGAGQGFGAIIRMGVEGGVGGYGISARWRPTRGGPH